MNIIPFVILIVAQLAFTIGDLLARKELAVRGFSAGTFMAGWFVIYLITRIIATAGQLYVFSTAELGRVMALFGALSIILANVLGFLVLKEVLPVGGYIGIMLAITAFLILAFLPAR